MLIFPFEPLERVRFLEKNWKNVGWTFSHHTDGDEAKRIGWKCKGYPVVYTCDSLRYWIQRETVVESSPVSMSSYVKFTALNPKIETIQISPTQNSVIPR